MNGYEKAKTAIPALSVATTDTDEDVRSVAKRALASIKEAVGEAEASAVDEKLVPLLKQLRSSDIRTKLHAIAELELLGELARPAGAVLVEYGMMHSNPKVKGSANAAFEKIDPAVY